MGTSKIQPVRIRAARADEYAAAGALVEQAYRDGGELTGERDEHGYGAVLRDVEGRAGDSEVLVAVRSEELVGTVTLLPPGARGAELARGQEQEFRFLGVARSAWGTGVGDAMVEAILAHGRRHRRDTVIGIRVGNDAGERLYARHAFHPVPERDWEPLPGIVLRAFVHPYEG